MWMLNGTARAKFPYAIGLNAGHRIRPYVNSAGPKGASDLLPCRMVQALSQRRSDSPVINQAQCGNLLLQCMEPADFALLVPFLRRVPLELTSHLAKAGKPIEKLYFLEGGIGGFLDVLSDGRQLSIGLVGREGFVGWQLLMHDSRWPYDVVVRGTSSTAIEIDADDFMLAVGQSVSLQRLMLRFASTFVAQMGRTIVSNLIHPIERRAARWILLYHDRLPGDEIALTHEELSAMLGVRRASITDAMHLLEGERAIKGLRGRVVVLDRAVLETIAGEAYGFPEAEYRRLIAPLHRAW